MTSIVKDLFIILRVISSVRGMLGSLASISFAIGIMGGYLVTDFFDFNSQIAVFMVVPVVFLIIFSVFPESPEFLQQQSNQDVSTV